MADIESTINIKATADTSNAERQLDALSASFDKLNGSIGGLSVSESAIADSLNRIGTQGSAFDKMNESMQGVNSSVNDISTGTGNIVTNMDSAVTSTAGLAKEMSAGVVTSVSMVITGINQLLELLGKVYDMVSDLSEVAMEIEQTLFSMSEILGGEISGDILEFTEAMQDMYGLDGTTLLVNLNDIATAVSKLGLASEDAVKVTENLGIFAQNLGSLTGDFSKAYSDVATAIMQGRITKNSSLWNILSPDEIKEMRSLNSEVERFNYLMNRADRVSGVFEDFLGTESGQIYLLNQQFGRLKSNVGAVAKHIYATWAPVITSIIKGLNAIIEKIMTLFNIGYDAFDFEGISSGFGQATDGIEDGSKKASKAISELKRQVLSFDDVIQLNEDKDNDGLDEVDLSNFEDLIDLTKKQKDAEKDAVSWLDRLKAELEELFKRAETGFNKAWEAGKGDKAVQDILNNLQTIRDQLVEIFTDPEVAASSKKMVEQWAETIGAITGSLAVTVANITAGVTGGIAKWLIDDEEYLKDKIVDINDELFHLGQNIENTALLWADFSTVFNSEQFSTMIEGLIRVPESLYLEATDLGLSIANSIVDGFNIIWAQNQEGFKTAAENTFGIIGDTANEVADEVQDLGETINNFYDNDLAPKISQTAGMIAQLTGTVLNGWNNDIVPVLDELDERLNRLFNEHIKPFFNEFFVLWSQMSSGFTALNEQILFPFIDTLVGFIIPTIANNLKALFDNIEVIIGGIMDMLTGLVRFVSGILTGDFPKAFDGFVGIFKGYINLIIGLIETQLNWIIGAINALLSGLDNAVSKVGLTPLNVRISEFKLPRLATGGIVTGSTIANIGEAGREAVIPLENKGVMKELASEIVGALNGGNNTPVVIDMSAANKPVYTRSEYLAMADIFAEAMKARGVAVSMEY